MSTKIVIRDLRAFLKERGVAQALLKRQLHQRHSEMTSKIATEVHQNRVEITCLLNYLHQVKGTGSHHRVDPSDYALYRVYHDIFVQKYQPDLDPVVESTPIALPRANEAGTMPVKVSWVMRILGAVSGCFKS